RGGPECQGSTARTPPWSGFPDAANSSRCPRGDECPRSSGSAQPRYRVRSWSVPVPKSMSDRECQIPVRRAISDLAATRKASSEDLFDCARNRVYLGHSVDRAEDPTVAIIGQDRRRLTMVDFEPCLDRLRPVVGTARKLAAAANIADLVDLGPVVAFVIARAALLAAEASG